MQTCVKAAAKAAFFGPTVASLAPEASSSTVSLVEVSPSTEMRLKLTSMDWLQVAGQHGWFDGCVGQDVDQHGGVGHQLRVNHARALAQGGNANFAWLAVRTGNLNPGEGGLFHRVGGQDGLRNPLKMVGLGA